MRIKNFRRGLAAAAGLGVTLAGGAVPAHASASSVPVRAGMVIVEPGTVGSAVAPCPDGAAPTGGGFLNIDALDSTSDVVTAMSRPVGDGWQVTAFNATAVPQPVYAYALCAPATGEPIRAAMVNVQPGAQGAVDVGCEAGTSVTGGGFLNIDALDKASDVEIAMSHPDVNGWGISAFNATTAPHPVFVYAICAPTPRQPTRAAMVNVQPGAQGTVGVACEAGTSVTGGGFLNIDGLKGASDVEIAASRPDGNGWQVTAFNGTAAPHPVFVFATCVAD